jgi:hypothetical protein
MIWALNEELVSLDDQDIDFKLAHLLMNCIIFTNNGWWYAESGVSWPKDSISHHVNCNDTFAYACGDSEDITHDGVHELYAMWRKDPHYGSTVWCMKKRKIMPILQIEKAIRDAGIWDLDAIKAEWG